MKYIFFLLFPFLLFAQEKAVLVTYKVIYNNTEFPTTKKEYLYVSNNQKKTVYFIESVDKTEENVKTERSEDIDVDVVILRFWKKNI